MQSTRAQTIELNQAVQRTWAMMVNCSKLVGMGWTTWRSCRATGGWASCEEQRRVQIHNYAWGPAQGRTLLLRLPLNPGARRYSW